MAKEFKEVRIQGVKELIRISEDGHELYYKGKKVHQSLIKTKQHRHGYHQVSIEGNRIYVHRIVAEAFVPNTHPVSYKMILHKDCDTSNNHYSNLEWGDRKKLLENRTRNGLQNAPQMPETYRGSSKISHEEALKIAKRLENGEYAKDICLEYNVSEMSIARIRKRYLKQPASIRYPSGVKKTAMRLLEKHQPHELVEITGIKYHTLYRWKKELVKD